MPALPPSWRAGKMTALAASARGAKVTAIMRTLYHLPFDPCSRAIRLLIGEKGLPCALVDAGARSESATPEGRARLLRLNPAGDCPVLVDVALTGEEIAVSPEAAIREYLEEAYAQPSCLPATSAGRAEARRLVHWFHHKFEAEVQTGLTRARTSGRALPFAPPSLERLEESRRALPWHLDYLSFLLEQRAWLAGARLTVADLAGAAHLSVCDYFGLVSWRDFPDVREWYARMKSRPAMRLVLADRLPGLSPPLHYHDPDF